MQDSLERFLEQVAHRGSWVGGGSVAALSAALAAALLEKLTLRPQSARRLRGIRQECFRLIQRDAQMFARVIRATRAKNGQAFQRSLKGATEVPYRVFKRAHTIQAVCRAQQRSIKPQFQSDLWCAMALALAASESALALIRTNLAWLDDPAYLKTMQRRLHSVTRRHASPRI
jgi:formiminotetrahydrofolate cyclodeaminase